MTRTERRKDKKKYEKDFVHFCWVFHADDSHHEECLLHWQHEADDG